MKSFAKKIVVAAALAGLGVAAFSQMPLHDMADDHHANRMHHGRMDSEKMRVHMEKKAADLKEKLKLTAAQQASWTSYVEAMKPGNLTREARPDHAQMSKMTTPERLEVMKSMHDQRSAKMEQHAAATKTFYMGLSTDQKKIFDDETMKMGHRGGHKDHHQMSEKKHGKKPSGQS